MTRIFTLALLTLLSGCGDPTIVAVRDGDMAGCGSSGHLRGPTVAEVADCRAWQAEKHKDAE